MSPDDHIPPNEAPAGPAHGHTAGARVSTVAPPPIRVAAFDLDGTVIWADSLVAFLRWRLGRLGFLARMGALTPALARYAAVTGHGPEQDEEARTRLKEALLRLAFAGRPAASVRAAAGQFWRGPGARLMRADARKAIAAARSAQLRPVLVTAAPDVVAEPLADLLGMDCEATRLAAPGGILTGRITGANCRGEEKVRRLEARYGFAVHLDVAYGDSAGDAAMLARAARPRFRTLQDGPRGWLARWGRAYL